MFSYLRLLVSVSVSVPVLTLVFLLGLLSRPLGVFMHRKWAALQLKIFGIELRIENPIGHHEPGNKMILMLNQDSLLEMFILPLIAWPDTRWLVNIEYAVTPFVGWVHLAFRDFVIIRQNPKLSRKAFDRVTRCLKAKGAVGLSIEGRRAPDGKLGKYNKSPIVAAINAGATIVPLVILGARDLLPYGTIRIKPGTVTVKFLKEIPTKNLRYENRDDILERLRTSAEKELG